ncbi:hypothetical protein DSBG_1459 [Desulfosporosinus sp. BG]|nr:hypothetical protein DSBG_1459 [Desulfosporosinus sp. BG]
MHWTQLRLTGFTLQNPSLLWGIGARYGVFGDGFALQE